MNKSEAQELVRTWISLQKCHRDKGDCDHLFWAYEKLDHLIDDNPEKAWMIIKQIYVADQSDITFENLAAGPLEDLLTRHGDEFIQEVIDLAKKDSNFNELLGGVWQDAIPDHIWGKLQETIEQHW